MERIHPLKTCGTCGNNSDPLGGVDIRSKWYCAKCWTKFINGKLK